MVRTAVEGTSKIALAAHVVCRNTSGPLRMLFDRDKGVMYELNESASSIVGMLAEGEQTLDELLDALAQDYDASHDTLTEDVTLLIKDFRSAGLVEVETSSQEA
jgi:Coenzyme PQQ synthesis protein D (PqqD)